MISAVVVDDEQSAIIIMRGLVNKYGGNTINIVGEYKTVEAARAGIEEKRPDLVFLDVQLNRETCFQLLEKVKHIPFEIIFITAHEKYATQAFQCCAIDFLVKPVSIPLFQTAIAKLHDKKYRDDAIKKLNALLYNTREPRGMDKRICVPVADGMEYLKAGNIMHCQSESNYTHIFLLNGDKLVIPRTLKDFEEMLFDCDFLRIHNSHLINLHQVKKFNKVDGYSVIMENGTILEVATRRKEELIMRLAEIHPYKML